jgi:hypothetical protein
LSQAETGGGRKHFRPAPAAPMPAS